MNKREELIDLFLIYESLFTKKQVNYFKDYYFEDLSLSEIAENYGVTKTLIGKTIKQVENKLYLYENNLHINKINKSIKEIYESTTDTKTKKQLEELIK